jgi:hypothetical protein
MTIRFPLCVSPRPGHQVFADMKDLPPGKERDDAIWDELAAGNIPDFLRTTSVVSLSMGAMYGQIDVVPDYLSIGTTLDYVHVPMTPLLAQRVCDEWGAQLPTKHLVDMIWRSALAKLAPMPWGPPYDASMLSVDRFVAHSDRVQVQLRTWIHDNAPAAGLDASTLTAGHKKDVVVTPELEHFPHHVAIYGWHQLNGVPIQSLNPRRGGASNTHEDTYADYSHGIRLLAGTMIVNGSPIDFGEVLADAHLYALVSDEGPSTIWHY